MLHHLPPPIQAYFRAANDGDVDRIVAAFTDDAVVRDEGEEHVGLDAIRAWASRTTLAYRPVAEITSFEEAPGELRVLATVSGTFPGSPAALRYTLRLRDDRIAWWAATLP